MFTSYCNHCGRNWNNETPNCPTCGLDDHDAVERRVRHKTKPQRKETMNDEEEYMDDPSEGFAAMFADAGKEGLKLAAADEANKALTSFVVKGLEAAGMDPKKLEAPLVQKAIPVAAASFALFMATNYPDMVPKAELVKLAAKRALSTASGDALRPMFAAAVPTFLALAASGQKMMELEGEVAQDKPKAKSKAKSSEGIDIDFADISDDDEVQDAEFDNVVDVSPAQAG